ncbi:MAG: tryptophan--tRNA ligase [Chitinophagales bacterium]|nr:tryptophan--tRNA ligase [Chitinophagales bacterium]MDW8419278.1 tryptophan--tRNA ligase [Chitinophagales bacterium]
MAGAVQKEIAVSGVRPTGRQHLGNYFGAVKNFVAMQDMYEGYFFVADYHSLTTHPNAADLSEKSLYIALIYLACGLDPNRCTLYLQSDVPQIPELYLIFNMLAYLGELEREATFKEKVRTQPHNVNAGLLTYPVLMTVDIIIHKARKVPVGKDQQQHVEMSRDLVRRFNNLYKVNYFPEPEPFSFSDTLLNIPSLDGEGKMSKSKPDYTCIYLDDTPEQIRKKIMRMPTDSGPTAPNSEMSVYVRNIFDLLKLVSQADTVRHFEEAYNQCTIRYGDLKKQLAEDIIQYLKPIRENIEALSADENRVYEILKDGGSKARASAAQTLQDVREIIGLKNFKA